MTEPAETPFDVTTIAVQKYQHLKDLDGVEDDAAAITGLLRRLGGVAAGPRPADEVLDRSTVERRLVDWRSRRDHPSSVLVWMGHGRPGIPHAALACYDTSEPIPATGLGTQVMAMNLSYDWQRREPVDAWALVIVEACGAGDFINHVNHLIAADPPRGLCLIGVASSGASYLGQLRNALQRVTDRLTTNHTEVRLGDLIKSLQRDLGGASVVEHSVGLIDLRHRPPVQATICAPLDIYAELTAFLAAAPADVRNHFFPKALAAEQGEFGQYFVGRHAQRAAVRSWLRAATRGMLIVTGRPGAGKSALLGNLLLRSNPRWRTELAQAGLEQAGDADLDPPDGAFDAAVNLAKLTTGELVRRLSLALGVPLLVQSPGWSGDDTDALVGGLAERRFTVLVDGLDEGVEPIATASTVLRRLAELPHGRVVVGTRPSTGDAVDERPAPATDLVDALWAPGAQLVVLSRDREAVAEYVRRRLGAADLPLPAAQVTAGVERLAERIGALGAGKDFLFARLVVHEVLARPAVLLEPALDDLLAGDHRDLFRAAVERLTAASPNAYPLLQALAFAGGRGIPRTERSWATAAGGLSGALTEVPESDIDELLVRAAPYILLDAEYGYGVYRLAHQTYRTIFSPEG